MALVLKRLYQDYFWAMEDLSDPRVLKFPLMSSPIPVIIILVLWHKFIFIWGPAWMKHREPYNLRNIMIGYNAVQVALNMYVLYICVKNLNLLDIFCMPVDYSNSTAGLEFLYTTYLYFMLKMLDLLDTVFFVLRKKYTHVSFLHTYHHTGMVLLGWGGAKFLGGGHAYHLGLANSLIHSILYSYYMLTAYDSKYGKVIWLKKFITQAQLIQFGYLLITFSLLLLTNCTFPKCVSILIIPQNLFMFVLFGDFYVKTYILPDRRKKKEQLKKAALD